MKEYYTLKLLFPDAPVPDGYLVPAGLADEDEDGAHFLGMPVFPVAVTKGLESGDEFVTIAWKTDTAWERLDVSRADLAQKRSCLKQLAAKGCRVNEQNIGEAMSQLRALEELNKGLLPPTLLTNRLGLHKVNGETVFLHGTTLLTAPGSSCKLRFNSKSQEAIRQVSAFETYGTLASWKEAVACAAGFPYLALALYASFASVLARLLKTPPAILDINGPTSTGKTSLLKAAASVWGEPNGMIGNWNASPPAIQAMAAIKADLPTFLDDTKRLIDDKKLASMVYDMTSGQSAMRSKSNGQARGMLSWQGMFLSTGEAPLTSLSKVKHGGQHGRVLVLSGLPFGKKDADTAKLIHVLTRSVSANFGHAGPMVVMHLLAHPECIEKLRREFDEKRGDYAEKAGGNALAGRLGEQVALLEVAAELAHEVLGFAWDFHPAIEKAWEQTVKRTSETMMVNQALDVIHQHAELNRENFYSAKSEQPPRRLEGRWDSCPNWKYLAMLTGVFEPLLKHNGLDPEAIKAELREKGYLDADKDRSDKKVSIGSRQSKPRMIVIKRKAFIDVGLAGTADTEAPEQDDDTEA